MQSAEKQRVREQLHEQCTDGVIACRAALELAGRLGVSPSTVGELADEEQIKIVSCQLGCF